MSKPSIQCRIPLAWQLQLETIAQRSGQSMEQLIYQAIEQYLGQIENKASPAEDLRLELLALSARVAMLEQHTQLAQSVRSQRFVSELSRMPQPAFALENPLEDDVEDEPDEVLTSFLEDAPARQTIAPNQPRSDEEIEDEPDEILPDFLNS